MLTWTGNRTGGVVGRPVNLDFACAMPNTDTVSDAPPIRRITVATRYPADRRKLLEALQARLGYDYLADVIEEALDEKLTRHGLLERAA